MFRAGEIDSSGTSSLGVALDDAELGGDGLFVGHMDELRDLADEVILVFVQGAVGVGHPPHLLDELNFLSEAEGTLI